ncbi:MAG: endonuclease/exonuclease/phosphatase family protein [Bacteroidia bacterium]|nr:endonuclease/exonuclease/phosphatase family protein [Bacteroidia bacterium]
MATQRIIRIGTFNLFNLVLPEHQYHHDRQIDRRDYNRKLDWIAAQLDEMKADIVGFQEVFHTEALAEALQRTHKLRTASYVVAAPTGDQPRVALVSRFPIKSHHVYESCPSPLTFEGHQIPIKKFSRPVLKATVEFPDGTEVDIFVTHLKSKRPSLESGENRTDPLDIAKGSARALIRRATEAAGLREILLQELQHKRRPVILCGDVNDTGTAVTTQIISGEPPHRKFPMEVKKTIWDVLLYHVKDIQARQALVDVYFTHIHNGFHEALDHIMVSEEFVRENRNGVGAVEYVRVFNDHLIDETLMDEDIPVWASDHGQVVAVIEMKKER